MNTKMLLRFIVPFLIAVGLPILAKATHIVGGEITYECLGNNRYALTLKVYRDCFFGREPFDNPGYIGIYNLRGDLIQTVLVRPGARDTLEPTLDDPCLVVPPNVCVDTVTYKAVVTLSNNPVGGAYQITYVRCCRNETIDNIIDPVETGAVYDIYLTREAMLQCNNSPVFNNLPPNYICADKPFVFDHSARDPDGDSLVYKLCTPYSGGSISNPRPIPPRNPPPFDEVIWQTGFGLDNLFGMGQPLRIDTETGRLMAVPGLQGQFVVGVCVEEYDRETGQLLSTVRRDFQYNVGLCGTKVAVFFAPETSCEPRVKFDNQSNNAESFRWYFDYPRTNLTSTEKSPTFTFPRPGTYNVALIADPGSICADTSIKQIIIRENTIDIDFQIEELECQSETILNLGDRSTDPNSPINKWEWTITYGDQVVRTSTERNPTFVVPSGSQGTIRLKVTTADGCSKTLEKPFETGINPPPIDLIPDTIIACQGSIIELNPDAPNNSNLVYRWSPSNLVSDANAANPLFTGTQSATLTVRITQGGTSCELSKQVRVIINTPPRVNLGQNQEICLRDTVTLTANVTGGRAPYQFAWNRGSGQSQRVSPVLSTSYIVTVTDANGCSDVDSVRVNVNAVPGVIVGADDTSICTGDSTTIRATVNAGTPPLTFRWNQGLSNAATHIVRPAQTTTYAVTVTDANGCSAFDDIRINVSARPSLSIDTVFCNANLTNYQVNIRTNASSVRASAGTVINNNDGTFSIVNIPNGQDVRITAIDNNCEAIINVNAPTCVCPEVAAPISMGNRRICQGEAPPLLIATVPNGQTVDWFDAPSGGNLLLEGNNSFIPTQPGTYYARARDLATGCTSTTRTAVTFSINPSPSATASASLTTVCAGDMVQLNATASGGTAPYEFRWSQDLGQEQNPVATPLVTTIYTVTVTDVNGCRDTARVTINVDPLPRIDSIRTTCSQDLMTYSVRVVTNGNTVTSNVGTVTSLGGGVFVISAIPISQNLVFVATFNATNCGRRVSVNRPDCQCPDVDSPISGGDQTICAGQPIPTLTVKVGPNQTADWYSVETGGDTLLLGSTSFTPTEAGIYYAVARDTITQCTSRVRTAVRLVINTALRVNVTASETEICEGQSADLSTVSGGTPPFTYNWNQNLGSGQNKTVRPPQTTTYIVTVSDGAGCTGMDTITIRVNPQPDVSINADQDTICAGDLVTLTASATGGDSPYTFNWNQGLGSGATQTARPTQTSTYQVIANDQNNCSDTARIRIIVNPKPAVQLTANRTMICAGDTTILMVAASGGTAPYTFNWSASGLSGQNTTVNPTATTTYTVTVTDRNGCSDTASITINVTQGLEVEIAANDATLCPGESAELSVNIGNGTRPYTYRWNQGLPADSTQTVMPMQTTTYSVTVTDANGCSGTDDVIITVSPVPSVDATSSDTTICAGTSTSLSATASGGTGPYTFTWNPGNLNGQNQTVSPNDTTTYTVVVRDANGCMNSDQITIFVTPQPRASIGASDMTICAGDSTTLTATANGGLPPYTFNWDNGLGAGANKTVVPTQTTTYTVTVTDANDCESTASVTVNVSPALNVSITATQQNICQGDSTTLTVAVSGGSEPYTFRWNESLNNNASQTIRPTQTTTYSVTVNDANGCTGTAQITITVNPRPMVMVATDKDMICAGESVNLTAEATGTGNLSYRWSNGAQGREQTVNPAETTTYVVTVTDGNGCSGVDSVTITVNPRPSAAIQASPSTICLGGASTLVVTTTSGTMPYTYQWDQNLGTNDTVVVRPMQTTTYTVTVTDANGCRDTAQITITVSNGLNVSISADDETLCAGETARLTVNSDGSAPFIYTWNQGLPANRTQVVSPTQTTTYSVTVTDTNGCMGMDSITITVSPAPTVEVSADKDTICASDAVTLTAQGAGGTGNLSYRWSNGVTGATQVVNPTQTTTYTVTVTDANSCTNQDTAAASVTIFVNPRPNISIQASPTTICTGGASTLIIRATDGTVPYTYQWDQNLGTNDTVRVSPTQTTTYNVTVTDANGCTNATSVTITVRSGLNVSITADNETLCAGQSANLRVTSDGTAPFIFIWNQNLPADSIQMVTPTQTTTYRVTVTDVNGCSGTDDITITVNPRPDIFITATQDTICAGDSVSMSVQVTGGTSPLTFRWSNGFNGADQVVRPTTTTTYSLTVTDASGCSDTAQVIIRVNPRPIVNAGSDTLSCSGDAVTLNATATNGTAPYTFNWDQSLGAGAMKSITPTQPTTYNVTVTDANGCSNTDAVFVDVFPLPTDLPQDTITACANVSTPLAPNIVPRPGAVYRWTPTGILNDPNIPNPSIRVNRDTTVFVTITYRGVCTVLDTVRVKVPPAINLQASGDTTLCTTDPLTLRASSSVSGVQYVWSTNRNFNPAIGNRDTITITPNGSTIYYVRAGDANGCSETDSVVINAFPIRATITPAQVLCEPTNEVRLAVTNPDAVQRLNYNWQPSNAILTRRDSAIVLVNPVLATDFTVELVNQFGCRDTLQTTVTIVNLQVTATADPDTIFAGDTTQLNALGGCPSCTYSWTPATGLSNPNIANPIATPTETTVYRVLVSFGNCNDEASVRVVVNNVVCDKEHIFLPSAFSPNGDGINDVWRIRSNFLDQLRVSTWVLYNRWGQKIFETTDVNFAWDGTFRGQPLPPDVYGYYARIICPGNEELILQGNLTLIR